MNSISARLKFIRQARKLTQLQVAQAIGYKQATISYYELLNPYENEHEKRTIPDEVLDKLCDLYQCDKTWLKTGIGGPTDLLTSPLNSNDRKKVSKRVSEIPADLMEYGNILISSETKEYIKHGDILVINTRKKLLEGKIVILYDIANQKHLIARYNSSLLNKYHIYNSRDPVDLKNIEVIGVVQYVKKEVY